MIRLNSPKLRKKGSSRRLVRQHSKGAFVSRFRHLAPWMIVGSSVLLGVPCHAQGNLDAGRSPAQIFADSCAVCHRDARELRRSNANFLRQHYMSGSEEAAKMAGYLARLPPPEPRTPQPKRSAAAGAGTPPAAGANPAAGTNPAGANPTEASKQQAREQPASIDQAKSAQAQSKGRRPGAPAEARPLSQPSVEESPPAPLPVAEPRAPAQPSTTPPPSAAAAAASASRPLVPFQE